MAKPYFDKPQWWKSVGKQVEPATNPFSEAEERREEMQRKVMTSTPYSNVESEFERMMRQNLEKAARDSMVRASASAITYDDLRRTQASMIEHPHRPINVPANADDSQIRKTLKRGMRLQVSRHMAAADPYGQTTRFDAEFVLKARVDFTEGDDSRNVTRYEGLTSELEDQILKLAREIIRERKGII